MRFSLLFLSVLKCDKTTVKMWQNNFVLAQRNNSTIIFMSWWCNLGNGDMENQNRTHRSIASMRASETCIWTHYSQARTEPNTYGKHESFWNIWTHYSQARTELNTYGKHESFWNTNNTMPTCAVLWPLKSRYLIITSYRNTIPTVLYNLSSIT